MSLYSATVASRNRSKLAWVSKAISWCTRPTAAETANVTLQLRPRCPCMTPLTGIPCGALPWVWHVQILYPHSSLKTQLAKTPCSRNPSVYYPRCWRTHAEFQCHKHGIKSPRYGSLGHCRLLREVFLEFVLHLPKREQWICLNDILKIVVHVIICLGVTCPTSW